MVFIFVSTVTAFGLVFKIFSRNFGRLQMTSEFLRNFGWQYTLLVLIDFCPVQIEFLAWSFVSKTFDILSKTIMEYQIQP